MLIGNDAVLSKNKCTIFSNKMIFNVNANLFEIYLLEANFIGLRRGILSNGG